MEKMKMMKMMRGHISLCSFYPAAADSLDCSMTALTDNTEMPDDLDSSAAKHVVFVVRKSLRRCNTNRIATLHTPLNQNVRGQTQTLCREITKLIGIVGETGTETTKSECRPKVDGIAYLLCCIQSGIDIKYMQLWTVRCSAADNISSHVAEVVASVGILPESCKTELGARPEVWLGEGGAFAIEGTQDRDRTELYGVVSRAVGVEQTVRLDLVLVRDKEQRDCDKRSHCLVRAAPGLSVRRVAIFNERLYIMDREKTQTMPSFCVCARENSTESCSKNSARLMDATRRHEGPGTGAVHLVMRRRRNGSRRSAHYLVYW
ncbi:hypothetical protein F4604DRAFT_1690460 [Suillus subluteus]|nr:hypothetical protein F4604DRAFT_1690460 [Suillus subluteus]